MKLMHNWHIIIVLSILAFGIGHSVFRARIGFWTFLLLIVFVAPLLFLYQDEKYYTLVLISLIGGFVYAHRQVVLDIVDDVKEGVGWFSRLFKRKPKTPHNSQQESSYRQQQHDHYQNSHQPWKAEQQQREQEAREQRAREQRARENQRKQEQAEQQETEQAEQESQQKSQNNDQFRYSSSREIDNTETDSRSPLEILGLDASFTAAELKAAYKRESSRCHPDRWTTKPAAIRKMMEEEMMLVNWAYQRLK